MKFVKALLSSSWRTFAFLAAASLGVTPSFAQTSVSSNTSPVTLESVTKAVSGARTVFTHFSQERHLSLFDEPLRSEGYLCFEQPGSVRWEVTAPYQSILVSDGSGLAQFEKIDGAWKKIDLGLAAAMQNVVSQIAGVMKGDYARDQRTYSVSLITTNSEPTIQLSPRNEKMRKMIQAIEVHLSPELNATRSVVLREAAGDYTLIRFDQQQVNITFPGQVFDRKTPLPLDQLQSVLAKTK